mmetsp:Transcript_25506/g.60679  ORF Transcript_25506/g.60679 Transcript_25506/m.60679 type:complete len:144 (-) Transcript_25506:85-516(-)
MSKMDQLKALTKMRLAAASEADGRHGKEAGRQWTRFVFNSDAHLEEEGGRPGLAGALDSDTDEPAELRNALSFRTTEAAALAKTWEQSHADAIFGQNQKPEPATEPASKEGRLEHSVETLLAPDAATGGRSKGSWRQRAAQRG